MIEAFRLAYPDAPVVELSDAGRFTSGDATATLVAVLEVFLQTSGRA
ncbi:hypothetical protein [Streptomyces scopuliridis]